MNVSIIVPVYNAEPFLARCLGSIQAQTHSDLEIIIVNDGSTDKSRMICESAALADERIRLINQPNSGVSSARITGVCTVTSDFFCFVDADDFLEPNAIALFMEKAAKTGADLIIGKYRIVDENSQVIEPLLETINSDDSESTRNKFALFFGKSIATSVWNKLYRTNYVRALEISFNPALVFGEDMLYNLQLLASRPHIEMINDITYNYCVNSSSITNNYKKGLIHNYTILYLDYRQYLQSIARLEENRDILAFLAFTVIDTSCLNIAAFSGCPFYEMRSALRTFDSIPEIREGLVDLCKRDYLKEVERRDWKIFARVFAQIMIWRQYSVLARIQLIRFRLRR